MKIYVTAYDSLTGESLEHTYEAEAFDGLALLRAINKQDAEGVGGDEDPGLLFVNWTPFGAPKTAHAAAFVFKTKVRNYGYVLAGIAYRLP